MKQRLYFLVILIGTTVLNVHGQDWINGGNTLSANGSFGTKSNHSIIFKTNDTERARLTNSGNWGVGTATPLVKFHVNGFGAFGNRVTSANATRALNLVDDNAVMRVLRVSTVNSPAVEIISRATADGPNLAYWDLSAKPDDKSFRIRDRVGGGSGLDRLTVSASGNVGIGTTAPTTKLEVFRNDGQYLLAKFINAATTGDRSAILDIQNGDGVLWRYGVGGTGNGVGMNNGQFYIERQGAGPLFTISKEGRVGIGTSSPSTAKLYLDNTGNDVGISVEGGSRGMGSIGKWMGMFSAATSDDFSTSYGVWGINNATTGSRLALRGSAINIDRNGIGNFYGVFASADGGAFNAAGYFEGNVYSNNVLLTSDRKFKKDIIPIEHPLDQLLKLKPATYQFKTEEYKGMHLAKGKHMGLIADEVKQVFPQLVETAVHPAEFDKEDGKKLLSPEISYEAVNYFGLIPVLIASVQELSKKTDKIEK